MLCAQTLQAGKHGVDLGFAGDECGQRLVIVAGFGCHVFAPFCIIRIALSVTYINNNRSNFSAL
jgi:hypothetical protein